VDYYDTWTTAELYTELDTVARALALTREQATEAVNAGDVDTMLELTPGIRYYVARIAKVAGLIDSRPY